MRSYSELTKKRKMMVDLMLETYPDIEQSGTITFKQIRSLWDKIQEGRKDGTISKLGYPLWITVEQEFRTSSRGVYAVPLPSGNIAPVVTKTAKSKESKLTAPKLPVTLDVGNEQDVLTESEFAAELEAAGVF
jgi:hypothetical protein